MHGGQRNLVIHTFNVPHIKFLKKNVLWLTLKCARVTLALLNINIIVSI